MQTSNKEIQKKIEDYFECYYEGRNDIESISNLSKHSNDKNAFKNEEYISTNLLSKNTT